MFATVDIAAFFSVKILSLMLCPPNVCVSLAGEMKSGARSPAHSVALVIVHPRKRLKIWLRMLILLRKPLLLLRRPLGEGNESVRKVLLTLLKSY